MYQVPPVGGRQFTHIAEGSGPLAASLVDAFYFDFYSLALSKISRGTDRDLTDVKLLVQKKVISLEELDVAYQGVLTRFGKRPYINLDSQKFADRYAIVRQQLQQLA